MDFLTQLSKAMSVVLTAMLMIFFTVTAADDLPNWRPADQRGVNQFEPSGKEKVDFESVRVKIGGNFALQFQALDHSNGLAPKLDSNGVNQNGLMEIGPGFNNPVANLNLDVLLGSGIRMNLIMYLSSRHHTETWAKGGYVQVDNLDFLNSDIIDIAMLLVSFKVGHMEINYGDQHFRRTDNGNAMYNVFVGNYIMDAFTTEIGGELYFKAIDGLIAMFGVTDGEIKGNIENRDERWPSLYGKLGFDKKLTDILRTRLTASIYGTKSSVNNTLYAGDRSGSRYYHALEKIGSSTGSQFTSGRINPGFRDKVLAFQINPFIKFHGLEFFGAFERAQGRSVTETDDRAFIQLASELTYRFFKDENLYLGVRGNRVRGELSGSNTEVTVNRAQVALGWYINKNLLAKIEYVQQRHLNYPKTDLKYKGKFSGVVLEAVVGF